MHVASLSLLGLQTSVVLMVFSIGLSASHEDIVYLFRRPGQLLRSFFSMNVVMPVVAVAIALNFDVRAPVKIALVALSISPVPPLLPEREAQAGGRGSYAIGLLFAMAALAFLFVPLAVAVLDRIFPASLHTPFPAIVKLALLTVLMPLSAGVLVRKLAAGSAVRIVKPVFLVATVVLFAGLLPVLVKAMPAILSLLGNGTILVFGIFVVVGLFVGHLLGGPASADRAVLALSTACRHPAIAATIAIANFPGQNMVFPAILLYLLLNIILCLPYIVWLKRRPASPGASSPAHLTPR